MKFVIVNSVSLGVNLLAMYVLVGRLHYDSMISQIIATGFSIISNYAGNRLWVFHEIKLYDMNI